MQHLRFKLRLCELFGCRPSELDEEVYEECAMIWAIKSAENDTERHQSKHQTNRQKIIESFKKHHARTPHQDSS